MRTDEIKAAVASREAAVLAALDVQYPERGHRRCPYPHHEDLHPSWRFDDRTGRAYCTCIDSGSDDIFAVVMKMHGCTFDAAKVFVAEAIGRTDQIHGTKPPARSALAPQASAPAPTASTPPARRGINAAGRRLWNGSLPITADCIAGRYLTDRGCALPHPDGDLRYHPALRYPDGNAWPALVALVTDAVTGAPMTLHRTWLALDGIGKAPVEKPRWLLKGCPMAGGVIRLWPDDTVETGLAIAEGIETALTAARAFRPVWSLIVAGNLGAFPVLDGIEALTILMDDDDAGRRGAESCTTRWTAAGREVRVWRR